MYLPIEPSRTITEAWLRAVEEVDSRPHHEANNVIIDIGEPLSWGTFDDALAKLVDNFLKRFGAQPIQAVSNTIFPESLYRRYGYPGLFKVYLQDVYPYILKGSSDWGRYFERMISCRTSSDETRNLLEIMVEKMRRYTHESTRTYHNIYELSLHDPDLDIGIYDPRRDGKRLRGEQCMSFLSFKLNGDKQVILTVMYRNHFYIERLLGNLIGLGRLMKFVGTEAGLDVGSLTIVSTHAEIDSGGRWKRKDIEELLRNCQELRAKCLPAEAMG